MNYGDNGMQTETLQREGAVARKIEEETAKLPSDFFLWAAGVAILGSLALEVIGTRRQKRVGRLFGRAGRTVGVLGNAREPLAGFIGMWAPTFLLLGIYNRIVKAATSSR